MIFDHSPAHQTESNAFWSLWKCWAYKCFERYTSNCLYMLN